jgi:hypothetical protein
MKYCLRALLRLRSYRSQKRKRPYPNTHPTQYLQCTPPPEASHVMECCSHTAFIGLAGPVGKRCLPQRNDMFFGMPAGMPCTASSWCSANLKTWRQIFARVLGTTAQRWKEPMNNQRFPKAQISGNPFEGTSVQSLHFRHVCTARFVAVEGAEMTSGSHESPQRLRCKNARTH